MTTPSVDHIRDLGQAVYNIRFDAFCAALGLEDDDYARTKYAALNKLAHALAPFSDSTLAQLSAAYKSAEAHQ